MPAGKESFMKTRIDNNAFLYPMPVVLAGSVVNEKPNFMTVGWVSRVNYKPPMIAISLGPHLTNEGILEKQAFSINIPDVSLMQKTDYCGLFSGRMVDKSRVFYVFYGSLPGAPLIRECPVSMACRLHETVKLPVNMLFIGEIMEAYCDEVCMTDGKPDIQKINPFTLTMPDNHYWRVGDAVGRAWRAGAALKT
jgi:flavin reductase (DIM6/NTAB) family NADH-FMN oxidoreductase RutF